MDTHPNLKLTCIALAVAAGLAGVAQASEVNSPASVQPASAAENAADKKTEDEKKADAKKSKDDKDAEVEKIEVVGIRGSINRSLTSKQIATGVVDVISAEDIGKFPDANLAEALQRMTGVTITRNNGEGKNILVRGLGGTYNVTTLNNRRMASENTGRDFNYDVIASELISSIAVHKSAQASLVEGGMGGVVNIETRRPLSLKEPTLAASAKANYETRTGDYLPHASFLVGDTFADNSFGVIASAAYSKRTIRIDSYSGAGFFNESDRDWMFIHVDKNNDGQVQDGERVASKLPGYMYFTNAQDTRERIGASVALQWQPSDDLEFSLDTLYTRYNTDGRRYQLGIVTYDEDWTPGKPSFGNLHFADDGRIDRLTMTNDPMVELLNLSEPRTTDTWQAGWNGAWHVSDSLSAFVDVSRSESKNANRGDNNFVVSRGFVDAIEMDHSKGGKLPDVRILPGLNAEQRYGAHYTYLSGMQVTDTIDEFQLGTVWKPDSGWLSSLKAGLHSTRQSKSRDGYASRNPSMFSNGGQYFAGYGYTVPANADRFTVGEMTLFRIPGNVFTPGNFSNFLDGESSVRPDNWPSFDADALLAYYRSINADATDRYIMPTHRRDQSYVVGEDVDSAYVQAAFIGELAEMPYTLDVGLRYSRTRVTSEGHIYNYAALQLGENGRPIGNAWRQEIPVAMGDDYTDLLPSLNFKLNLRDDLIYRFSAAEVMSRPELDYLRTWVAVNFDDKTITMGAPGIEPERAKQIDMTLEWYYSPGNALTGGLYYKDIDSFISWQEAQNVEFAGYLWDITMPRGGQGATIKGVELAWVQSLDKLLPAPFDGLGFSLNFTYVDSEYADLALRALEFTGMSKRSYNAVLYYEKDGIEARLAYNWRDKSVAYPEDWGGVSYLDAYGQLDASFSYTLSEQFNLFAEVTNLTNERYTGYVGVSDQLNYLERFGTQYSLGVRAQF